MTTLCLADLPRADMEDVIDTSLLIRNSVRAYAGQDPIHARNLQRAIDMALFARRDGRSSARAISIGIAYLRKARRDTLNSPEDAA